MKRIFKSEIEFCDVTLACVDEEMQTHTLISQYLNLYVRDIKVQNQDEDVTSVENHAEQIENVIEKKTIDIHIASQHVEVLENFDANFDFKRLFPCNECPKMYSLKNDLRDHIRIHAERKSNSCSQCDKIFLYQHEVKVH